MHTNNVPGYDSLDDLVKEIGNLKYDKLASFLYKLSTELQRQSKNDKRRGRPQLSFLLYTASVPIYNSAKIMDRVWNICKPYMKV